MGQGPGTCEQGVYRRERALTMRQMLMSSKRLSDYMHFAVKEKNENIWIAQREGRAKDSNDRTQKTILQMMSMGGEGSIIERLQAVASRSAVYQL